jgi:hypothetical protein
MDASLPEQVAVRTYIETLPNPFPMQRMSNKVDTVSGHATIFWHRDQPNPAAPPANVWVLWADAGTGDATVSIPVTHPQVIARQIDGASETNRAENGRITVHLRGEAKMAPPVFIVDRPPGPLD